MYYYRNLHMEVVYMKCPHCKQEYDIKFLYEKKKCKNCGTPANLTVGQNNDVAVYILLLLIMQVFPRKKMHIQGPTEILMPGNR